MQKWVWTAETIETAERDHVLASGRSLEVSPTVSIYLYLSLSLSLSLVTDE